jgi:hypothetical protein
VGFELDPDYYAAASKRLEAAKAQVTMIDLMKPQQTSVLD